MIGVLVTFLMAIGASGIGRLILARAANRLDPAARWAVSGLLGLGTLGTLTLLIESIPGGVTSWGVGVVGIFVLAGLAVVVRDRAELKVARPEGAAILAPLVVTLGALMALVSVLAPSDMSDWDTLAYHLAVPKLWTTAGHAYSVPFIHHSNFPFAVDNLYLWGLMFGGESGAKAFQLAFYVLGAFLTLGFARPRYGSGPAYGSMVAYATIPVVLWESGSAYIDVAHGLFVAAGLLCAAMAVEDTENRGLVLPAAIALGLAAGSKYTGLQTFAAVGLTLVVLILAKRSVGIRWKELALAGLVASAVAAPWYVRNQLNTGNPVYPFFYEKLGGQNWDDRRAAIYRNEQQTFGVGQEGKGRDPLSVGHAMLGLAYQPGRYVNPGQSVGMGSPLGAVGVAAIALLVSVAILGGLGGFEALVLGTAGISLLMWAVLSQQSRYIVPVAIPAVVVGAGVLRRPGIGRALWGVIGIQAAWTLYLTNLQLVQTKLPVVMGKISPEDYRRATTPFAEAAESMNREVKPAKVALYDEVFGYLLDVPYFWANPGHSTLIPYDSMDSGAAYVDGLKRQGISHVYVNLSPVVKDRAFSQRWLAAMQGSDFSAEERQGLMSNWETKWHVLLADAVREGRLVLVKQYRQGLLFQVREGVN